jgi:hypothetical protein
MQEVSEHSGWRPLRVPARAQDSSPFGRLAVTHALMLAGDTLLTMALAGSLFFSISPTQARGKVALYLLLTMAPFAVLAPLIGPTLDRRGGGRRLVVILSAVGRALVCLVMARHLNGLLLFPEAFVFLVLSKTYLVTKSALVPSVVDDESMLVEANSRLAIIAVVAGFVAAAPGALVLKLSFLGAPWVLRLSAAVFVAAAVAGALLPKTTDARKQELSEDRAAMKTAGIRLAATAMAVLRGIVGFLTFLVAFSLRRGHAPSWWFGVVIASSMAGTFLGAVVAPRLRRVLAEERILTGALLLVAVVGLIAARIGGRPVMAMLAAAVGIAAAAGKLAFDSIVQRDALEHMRGRAFARFETRFQLVWVAGAFLPVVLSIDSRFGMGLLAFIAAFAAFSYIGGIRRSRHD